jgi:hypothetical protein
VRRASSTVRVLVSVGAAVALAGGAVIGLAGPASAGGSELEMDVHVTGPVPAGTQFTLQWSCPGNQGGDGAGPGTFQFDSTGSPETGNTISITDATTCTVTETVTGGAASVTTVCSVSGPDGGVSCNPDQSVTYAASGRFANGIVTVTNAFLAPLTVSPPSGSPGQQFTVSGSDCTQAAFGGDDTGGSVQATAGFTPPLTMSTTAADSTGDWSVTFTVPAGAASGPVAIGATCSDPAEYAASSFTVLPAATPLVASPTFTG